MKLVAEAFAKINRSLVVLGRRPDGYHELDTLFQTIDLSDELIFEDAASLELVTSEAELAGDDNLVVRAARALAEVAAVEPRARIGLVKHIPWGAGLGGASADAAATLRGLVALWGLAVPETTLHEIASRLGSDVPFFLYGGRARGRGRGEFLDVLPDDGREEGIVLLTPPFPLSTPAVYRALSAPALTDPPPASNLPGSDPGSFPDRNDLEPAAEALRGEVRRLREALAEAGAVSARLSGSGSTVFGVFRDLQSARLAAGGLGSLPEGTSIRVVRTLSRDEFSSRGLPRRPGSEN